MVELHWDVVNSPALREDRGPILRSLFRRSGRLSLDPLDHLIILSLHAVRAHQLDRLIQLVDADRWWRKYGRAYPPETILRRSNQWRAESEMWTLLTLAKKLLATAVPESLLEEICPRRVWNRLGVGFLGKATILHAHRALSQWRRKVARQLLKPVRPLPRRRLDHSESPIVDTFRLGHWDVAALPGLHRGFVLRVLGDVERGVVPSQLVKPGMRRTLSKSSADLRGSTVEVAIKQYRASGYRRLLGLRRPLAKARRNLSVTTWLAAVGVVCPRPLLLAASRQCKTVVYVTEWLSDYEMLRRRVPALARAPEAGEERKALCSALGRFLRNLHELGLDHPDLSEHNILVRREGSDMAFAVLDLEDAVVRARPVRSRVGRRLSRLSRFTKEYLHRTERLRGLCAYFECSRLTSKKKRKAAVKLEARAQSELEQRQRRIETVLTKLAQQLR
jgi:tRNA A-37 threonylcarbamoyl transferase component Bud32